MKSSPYDFSVRPTVVLASAKAATAMKRARAKGKYTSMGPVHQLHALAACLKDFDINLDRFLPCSALTPPANLLDDNWLFFFTDKEGSQTPAYGGCQRYLLLLVFQHLFTRCRLYTAHVRTNNDAKDPSKSLPFLQDWCQRRGLQ
jgi:hypothetical protein